MLISHFKAQLSDRSVWCPYEVLSSLTVGQVFVLIVCVSSAGGLSCLWVVLCGLRWSHTVSVTEQTWGVAGEKYYYQMDPIFSLGPLY